MNPLDMLGEMGALPITVALLIIGGILFFVFFVIGRSVNRPATKETLPGIALAKKGKKGKQEDGDAVKYPAYMITKGGELKFTTIAEQLGYVFTADLSMGIIGASGPCYLVRETDSGDILAYDPRTQVYDAKRSPQYAYFATHWDIVEEVFKIIKPWWESAPLWITVVVLALVFLAIIIFGGG